jgi:hypothetical protein
MNDDFAGGLVERLYEHTQANQSTNLGESAGAPLAPLHTRLQRLLDTIPYNAQRQGLSLLDLQACLRGRKGGLPHIGEMGAAMRKLGWQRQRAWSDENTAFSSRWYPPERV